MTSFPVTAGTRPRADSTPALCSASLSIAVRHGLRASGHKAAQARAHRHRGRSAAPASHGTTDDLSAANADRQLSGLRTRRCNPEGGSDDGNTALPIVPRTVACPRSHWPTSVSATSPHCRRFEKANSPLRPCPSRARWREQSRPNGGNLCRSSFWPRWPCRRRRRPSSQEIRIRIVLSGGRSGMRALRPSTSTFENSKILMRNF